MRVLFVRQDHVSPTGPVGEAFAELGYDVDDVLVVPEERFHSPDVRFTFPEPTDYDAIVPMGAPWSVYDEASIGRWIGAELDFLRRAHDAGVPVLGICFGGQALAAALGGGVERSPEPEIGWREIETDDPAVVEPGPWFQWHSDRWVLPAGITAVARTSSAQQVFVHGRSTGLQFHPELTSTMLDGWLRNGGEAHARALGVDPDQLVDETGRRTEEAAGRARRLVRGFVSRSAVGPW